MSLRYALRILLAGVIGLSVSLSPIRSFARETHSMGPERVRQIIQKVNFEGLPRSMQKLRELSRTRPAEMSAHLGQTLLFLLTVAGVELVQKELIARSEGKPSDKTLLEMSGIAARQLLDSGGTYLAILGAGVADLGLTYPAKALSAWLVDPKARPVIYQSLVRSIVATGSLIGWEIGTSLWSEAAMLLETEAEFERSKSLFGMGLGAFRGLIYSSDSRDLADRTLAKNMAGNLVRVALLDQKLRSRWIDNTFRTRIMSGDFAIMTAALTAAGVGTMLLPGGGTVAGFILGVGAIVIALNIPESIKDGITSGLHSVRAGFQWGRLRTVDLEIRDLMRAPQWTSLENRLNRLQQLLNDRQNMRSGVLTIEMEKARMVLRHLLREKSPLDQNTGRSHLRQIFSNILRMYAEQSEGLDQMARSRGLSQGQELPLQMTAALEGEQARLQLSAAFFMQLGLQIDELTSPTEGAMTYNSLSADGQELVKFVELGYSRGFDEKALNGTLEN